jgi:hypothetical protein
VRTAVLSEGILFDGNGFRSNLWDRTRFSDLRPIDTGHDNLAAQIFTSSNPLMAWLRQFESLKRAG